MLWFKEAFELFKKIKFMQVISWRENYSIFNFLLKSKNVVQDKKLQKLICLDNEKLLP